MNDVIDGGKESRERMWSQKGKLRFVGGFRVAALVALVFANLGCSGRLRPTFLSSPRLHNCRLRSKVLRQSTSHLRTLYPALAPTRNGTITVDDTHTVFYQEYGRSDDAALTALFLHGGPGAGCSPNHARFFNPAHYRIVLLDQRGSGRSLPRGEAFINNTIGHLIQDCETVRLRIGIDQWDLVLGGSWGSTLGLAYSQEYPSRVRSLVLRGVCLLRPSEVDWLTSRYAGAATMNPEAWREFSNAVGVDPLCDTGRDTLHAYYDRLLGENNSKHPSRLLAARAWMTWEIRISETARRLMEEKRNVTANDALLEVLVWNPIYGWSYTDCNGTRLPYHRQLRAFEESLTMRRGIASSSASSCVDIQMEPRPVASLVDDVPLDAINTTKWFGNMTASDLATYVPAQAMLTCFYSVNSRYALNNVDLLSPDRMSRIRSMRCIAIQGAMDVICPPDTALDLHIAWPEMELRIPTTSGHSMYDSAITHELVQATDRLAAEIKIDIRA